MLNVLLLFLLSSSASSFVFHHLEDKRWPWMHQMVLDPENNFHIKWFFDKNDETITFSGCVRTRGWFGFGISQSGGMTGSDLIITWVDSNSGRVHLQDRYAEDEEMPVIDDKQDWILESGFENETHTCVVFRRPFLTCDYEADAPITNDVTKIIWAYHDEDPIGPSAMISKHDHHRRGHKSVHLLNHKFENSNFYENRGELLKTWDITSNKFTLPHNSDTTYWCKIVSPSFRSKAHVVRIEPIISPASNAPFVHHMVLYRCLHPNPELFRDYLDMPGINCLDYANMPFDFFHCQTIYMVWATGGEAFNMPPNVGIPIFEDDETTYFMFEIHYDNPELRANVQDSSGLRLFYTEKLREYQADTATMGSVVDYRLIIPNGFENFTVSGHCSPECFRDKMPNTGINVLAALPHGHKHLERIVVRHFRGSQELEPLAEENNYDFNFQDFRRFEKERKILPGDQITVECTYNTESLEKPIFGGLSTQEEMCMVFLIYYPRMKSVRTCLSGLTPDTVMKLSNVDRIQSLDENDMNPMVVEPWQFSNHSLSRYVLEKQDWRIRETIPEDKLASFIRDTPQKAQCFWRKLEGIDGLVAMDEIQELITYPTNYRPYQKPKLKCRNSLNTATTFIPISNNQNVINHNNQNDNNLAHLTKSTSSSTSLSSSSNPSYVIIIILNITIYLFQSSSSLKS